VPASRRGTATLVLATVMALAAPAPARADAGPGGPAVGRIVAAEAGKAGVPGPMTITVEANGAPAGAAPGPSLEAGTPMAWSYEVTNGGTGSLWALYMWHEGVGAADCPDRSLAPGETVRCTATGAADAGTHAAAVSAWAWDDAGAPTAGEAVAYYTGLAPAGAAVPAIDLEALAAGKDADAPPGPVVAPGRTVTFRYRVRNTGKVTLWGVWVHDRVLGTIACPTRTLAPGEQMVCLVRRAAEAGWYASSVEARASDFAGTEVVDEDLLHYFGAAPAASVGLEALVEGFDEDTPPGPRVGRPGETITFAYLVTNTGGLPLTAVKVRDDAPRTVTCPARTLAPGETMACAASTVAQLGEFASTARVTARSGSTVSADSDPIYYHVRHEPRIHHLAVEVTVNGRAADDPTGPNIPIGRQANFAYLVTYTGNNVVYNVTIQDPFVPEALLSCDGDRQLAAGEALRCTASVPAIPGQYAALVTVVSWDADGLRVTAEDRVHYYGMA
jgi:uncharacterized repeat protein (TIGR01451 family)